MIVPTLLCSALILNVKWETFCKHFLFPVNWVEWGCGLGPLGVGPRYDHNLFPPLTHNHHSMRGKLPPKTLFPARMGNDKKVWQKLGGDDGAVGMNHQITPSLASSFHQLLFENLRQPSGKTLELFLRHLGEDNCRHWIWNKTLKILRYLLFFVNYWKLLCDKSDVSMYQYINQYISMTSSFFLL